MERIKYRISLDMFEVASQTTIKAKKGDTACSIHITLMENGKVYKIDEGCTAFFSAKKPDDKYLFNSETCRIEDNTIIYDFTKQTTPIEGIVECEVVLKKGEDKLTSPRFNLKVDATVYNGEDIISTPEADALKELTDRAEEIVNQYDEGIIVGKGYVDNNFANALKGSVSGKVVAIRDVSPVQHDIKVKATPVVVADTNVSAGNSITFEPITEWVVTTSLMRGYISFKLSDETYKNSEYSPNELGGVAKYIKAECKDGVCTFYYYDDEAMTSLWHSYTTEGWNKPLVGVVPDDDDIHIKVEAAIQDSVEVKLYGKNLLPDKKVFLGGNIYFGVTSYSTQSVPLKKGTYTFSFVSDAFATGIYILTADGKTEITKDFNKKNRITFTLTEDMGVRIRAYSPQFTSKDDVVSAQVELGSSVTEHEPYIEPATHTVMADGTAFESVYPSMTFVPEADGVELSVEYNRDINKAIAEIQQVIAQLQTLAVATVPMNEEV